MTHELSRVQLGQLDVTLRSCMGAISGTYHPISFIVYNFHTVALISLI